MNQIEEEEEIEEVEEREESPKATKNRTKKRSIEVASASMPVRSPSPEAGPSFDPHDFDEDDKILVDTRLKSMMLLALSFEKNFPKDFYDKLAANNKLKGILKPITNAELEKLNRLMEERGYESVKVRLGDSYKVPDMSRYYNR